MNIQASVCLSSACRAMSLTLRLCEDRDGGKHMLGAPACAKQATRPRPRDARASPPQTSACMPILWQEAFASSNEAQLPGRYCMIRMFQSREPERLQLFLIQVTQPLRAYDIDATDALLLAVLRRSLYTYLYSDRIRVPHTAATRLRRVASTV
ncbi:hypothetical protein FA95DRAFT_1554706 [Auriscalpium vulgare]|uniref:Uncharacterized protein n=1 Tax=Auriscalpium vulgare TaxID=40419 RepID=A0ACB8S5E5_9AGAM|nr:hypothetical protein FA95DRAFT_1554706 [Auriscalpium vulgare]